MAGTRTRPRVRERNPIDETRNPFQRHRGPIGGGGSGGSDQEGSGGGETWQPPTSPGVTETRLVYYARYTKPDGVNITDDTVTVIDYDTKVEDRYAIVTTGASWSAVMPSDGYLRIKASIRFVTLDVWARGEEVSLYARVNGANYAGLYLRDDIVSSGTDISVVANGECMIPVSVGDAVDVTIYQKSGGNRATSNSAEWNYIELWLEA